MRCQACQVLYDANQQGMDRTRCPSCVAVGRPVLTRADGLAVPAPAEDVETVGEAEGEFIDCPECAEPIRSRARSCRYCGHDLEGGRRPASLPTPAARSLAARSPMREAEHVVLHVPKSPGVAVILSFFWAGLGQLYAGAIGRGLAIMLLPGVGLLMLFVPMFAAWNEGPALEREANRAAIGGVGMVIVVAGLCFWCWQIFDAYATAMAANRRAFGRSPARRRS